MALSSHFCTTFASAVLGACNATPAVANSYVTVVAPPHPNLSYHCPRWLRCHLCKLRHCLCKVRSFLCQLDCRLCQLCHRLYADSAITSASSTITSPTAVTCSATSI
jgi:hypothetical protein